MTIALWCVLIAGLLPYTAALIAKAGGTERFDNNNPRAWLARQEGWRARANAAQANGFETFPLFAAAVIIAHMLRGPQAMVDTLAMVFIAARVAYLGLQRCSTRPPGRPSASRASSGTSSCATPWSRSSSRPTSAGS